MDFRFVGSTSDLTDKIKVSLRVIPDGADADQWLPVGAFWLTEDEVAEFERQHFVTVERGPQGQLFRGAA